MADRTHIIEITTAVQAPASIKNAGYAGENNATAIRMNLPADYIGGFTYSLDITTGSGETYPYPVLLGDGDDFLIFELSHALTDKGTAEIVLNITETATDMVVKTRSVYLQLIGRDIDTYAEFEEPYVPETTATEDCLNAVALVNEKIVEIDAVVDEALSEWENLHSPISVLVEDYGAKGDGVTDDRASIQAAIDYAGANGLNVIFTAGKIYSVVAQAFRGNLIDVAYSDMVIDLNGSEIVLASCAYPEFNIFRVSHQSNVKIINGKIRGDRTTHNYSVYSGAPTQTTHELGYGVYVHDSDVVLEELEIYDMIGDAVLCKDSQMDGGTTTTGSLTINNCEFHHCRRQGVSILEFDYVLINGCNIHHIGSWGTGTGSTGTAPMSGIDIEPNLTKVVRYVEVRNTRITNTTRHAIIGGDTAIPIRYTISEVVLDNVYATTMCSLHDITLLRIKGCYFYYDVDISGEYMYLQADICQNSVIRSAVANKLIYLMGEFLGCYIEGYSSTLHAGTQISGTGLYKACSFKNIMGRTTSEVPYRGFIYYGSSYGTPEFLGCKFSYCSFNFRTVGTVIASGNKFTNCDLYVDNSYKVTFDKCTFVECTTAANTGGIETVIFQGCYLSSTTATSLFSTSAKFILNSYIELADVSSADVWRKYTSGSSYNSYFKITGSIPGNTYLPRGNTCVFELNEADSAIIPAEDQLNCNIIVAGVVINEISYGVGVPDMTEYDTVLTLNGGNYWSTTGSIEFALPTATAGKENTFKLFVKVTDAAHAVTFAPPGGERLGSVAHTFGAGTHLVEGLYDPINSKWLLGCSAIGVPA